MMSIQDYIDTIAPTPDWLEAIGAKAKKRLHKLTMRQIDAEITVARSQRRNKALTQPAK